MIGGAELRLLIFIFARTTGFVLFNPLLGRRNLPATVRGGIVFVLSVMMFSFSEGSVAAPVGLIDFAVRIVLEMGMGFFLGLIVNIFFYIPLLAGEMVDTQMGMTMAKMYDAGSQASMSVTSSILTILMTMLFFAANGHHTLLRILLTSGEVVPFGAVSLGDAAVNAILQIFIDCTVLAVKLCLPILAAELIGQVGMGILMKVIPQINVFAINIELKVIIGLLLLLLLLAPMSEFLLEAERTMLDTMREVLPLTG